MSFDLEGLNPPQREAVLTTEGPLLVLAGAGSGKTRVLTYRIAHLIADEGVAPWSILAITFTNRAAAEMRDRLGRLVGPEVRGMWVSTFHSMCVRMLRADAPLLGFTKNFTIYDDDDSKRLFKEIMAEMDLDTKRFPINMLRNRISAAKNELISPQTMLDESHDFASQVAARVYVRLQERLREANAFDFDDLLYYAYRLLKDNPDVLSAYQRRFRYLLVDEYQDTNKAQYELTRLLAAESRNIMVVGDDDQSIYSWRGADIRNILSFRDDYPEAHVVKLEQNYRSTGTILAAANEVISNNVKREQKRLFTEAGDGEKIGVYMATDERDEGRWIASEMESLHTLGASYDDMAVFYRTNAQSRMLEDMLLRAGVPYKIYGGVRFFDRAEIRDVMAYLTLVVNPMDDIAAKRIINTPRRGIGKTTTAHIEQLERENGVCFLDAAELCMADESIRMATRSAIGSFLNVFKEARTYEGDLRNVIERVIDKSGILAALEAERTEESMSRAENIKEFLSVVDEFVETHDEDDALFAAPTESSDAEEAPVRVLRGDSLEDFLEWVRLRTDLDSMGDETAAVTLMTIHSAKGLEFDIVFVAGMEESLFPHMNSMGDPTSIEEERRLAYVAITRARKRLFLTCAQTRSLMGQTNANPVSRFMREIPRELKKTSGVGSSGFAGTGWEKRGSRRGIAGSGSEAGEGRVFGLSSASGSAGRSSGANPNAGKKAAAKLTFAVGDLVDHKTFGRGTVTAVDGDVISVQFKATGQTKKLMKDYAPIVKLKQE